MYFISDPLAVPDRTESCRTVDCTITAIALGVLHANRPVPHTRQDTKMPRGKKLPG
jgi:hypothetical protein